MLGLQAFTEIDWMAFAGAEPFADGRDPIIAVGDVRVDDASAEIVLDGTGRQITWTMDDEPYSLLVEGVAATRVLAMLRREMTYAQIAALPGVEIHRV